MIVDNRRKAEEFLERIQLKNLEKLGINIQEWNNIEFDAKELAGLDTYMQECLKESVETRNNVLLSSPYEWNLSRLILQRLIDYIDTPEIRTFIKKEYKIQNIEERGFPYWGSVFSLDVSASYYGTDIDRGLITISYAAFEAAYILSLIIGNLIFNNGTLLTSYSEMKQYTESVPEFKHLLFDFLYCDSYYGFVLNANHGNLKGNTAVQLICDMFELFIVAHEYAHFVYGHTPISQEVPKPSKEKMIDVLQRRYKQELLADEMAASICKKVCQVKKIPPIFCDLGIHLLFIYLELHEQGVAYKPYKDSAVLTHPPVDGRKMALFNMHLREYYMLMGKEMDLYINEVCMQFNIKLKAFTKIHGSDSTHDVVRKYLASDNLS